MLAALLVVLFCTNAEFDAGTGKYFAQHQELFFIEPFNEHETHPIHLSPDLSVARCLDSAGPDCSTSGILTYPAGSSPAHPFG